MKLRPNKPSSTAPPRPLGQHGSALWDAVTSEYHIHDAGGRELLVLACASLDRAEQCREQIDRDGAMIDGGKGMLRENPLLKTELGNRAFVVRTLEKLGLNVEPLRSGVGRPPQGAGVFNV